jgi:uracil-DNA glycosylase family 4
VAEITSSVTFYPPSVTYTVPSIYYPGIGRLTWDYPDFSAGPVPCKLMVVGEAPGEEELEKHQYFVGPSGRILWPLIAHYTGLTRKEVYVTNLCPWRLDDSKKGEDKLTPEQFAECEGRLLLKLDKVRPAQVLAVGALAAKALLGSRFSRMEVCNGMSFGHMSAGSYNVVPCWHPAAALHDTGGKDPLVWTADAIQHWLKDRPVGELSVPPVLTHGIGPDSSPLLGIDTEGTISDPICLTWATHVARGLVYPREVPAFWEKLRKRGTQVVYHNAPWDWGVLEAMGVERPWEVPFKDTMELAYLTPATPRGLKDLGRRFFGLDMKSWEEVVMPYYEERVREAALAQIEMGTTLVTHSAKTGRPIKPKEVLTEQAKKLKRSLANTDKLKAYLGYTDPPSLRYAPFEVMQEYATLDPFVTLAVHDVLGGC